MQIVINIPKKLYDRYKEKDYIKRCDIDEFEKALDRGIILPKGHGRLIDVDAIKPKFCDSNIYIKYGEKGFWYYSVKDVNDTPTIIEADKENEE